MTERVLDRAIQAFGGGGLSQDQPLAAMFAWARVLRIADGPDEVHTRAVARHELKRLPRLWFLFFDYPNFVLTKQVMKSMFQKLVLFSFLL